MVPIFVACTLKNRLDFDIPSLYLLLALYHTYPHIKSNLFGTPQWCACVCFNKQRKYIVCFGYFLLRSHRRYLLWRANNNLKIFPHRYMWHFLMVVVRMMLIQNPFRQTTAKIIKQINSTNLAAGLLFRILKNNQKLNCFMRSNKSSSPTHRPAMPTTAWWSWATARPTQIETC